MLSILEEKKTCSAILSYSVKKKHKDIVCNGQEYP